MTELIAELGNNHQGDLSTAMKMVVAAAEAGADAVKLQKRSNRDLYTKAFYDSAYNSENAFGATYGEHREHLEFGKYAYRLLKIQAEDLGLRFYSTAFDPESVDFLVDVGVDGIKIASGDLTNTPLLAYAASTKLPLMVSSGAAGLEDVQRAVGLLRPLSPGFTLFQCTALYPCPAERLELKVIQTYKNLFPDLRIGFSSHFNGVSMPLAAVALGAEVVEVHVTLDRSMKGTDHAFSLEPQGLSKLVRDIRRFERALGQGEKQRCTDEEPAFLKMSKSLFASSDLPAMKVLSCDDIIIRSPGGIGLPPYRLKDLIGKRLVRPLQSEEPITERDVDGILAPKLLQPDLGRTEAVG